MKNNYKKELEVAKLSAKIAGDFLIKEYDKKRKVNFKKKHEIVTDADKKADLLITKTIKNTFPHHNILSEETLHKKTNDKYLWVVDPLDGTNNYAHKIPLFAVCIALAENKNIKVGVVYLPYFKEMFWAVKNNGAYLNNKKIITSKTMDIKNSFVVKCHGYDKKEQALDHKIFAGVDKASGSTRRIGCAGYELAKTAEGQLDGGYIIGTRPWDSAAGALIVKEAKGEVTNFKGEDWDLFDKNILFTNKILHKKLLKIINK